MTQIEIGRVIAVHGFQVKVELDSDHRSAVRAGIDGVDTHIRINAYVTFDLGAGDAILGVITDLHAHETFEPNSDDLTLELVRPRRIATAQLLGTVRTRPDGSFEFDPGVNLLPTLDTPTVPARPDVLRAVLEDAPVRNKPEGWNSKKPFDTRLPIGQATAARERTVFGSFNDIFSRPLAVVGNTGSGKSCTIAHLIQTAIKASSADSDGAGTERPHFFVIDINGEYARAFGVASGECRQPNRLYINGAESSLPIWLMNANEVCQWLSAAEQTQQPALINLWALAKGASTSAEKGQSDIHAALVHCENIRGILDGSGFYKGKGAVECWDALKGFVELSAVQNAVNTIESVLQAPRKDKTALSNSLGTSEKTFRDALLAVQQMLEEQLGTATFTIEQTADKPIFFPIAKLDNPANLDAAAELSPGDRSIRQFLQGLQLRMHNRRNDRRWHCFYNYEELKVHSFREWLVQLGIGSEKTRSVTVIDCSMLAHDVLPFVCAVLGRLLLELREQANAESRFDDPWVLVLEEAHNYVRPSRTNETRGEYVSRDTFERISKEGRKFGLSLMIASQRPSDISATVLSQCSNFITHRLQNPDDIDHFRRIVPSQSRRLIDQITILRAGEAVVVGSAFNVPSRVQVRRPDPEPTSSSSTPFVGWHSGAKAFDLKSSLRVWNVETIQQQQPPEDGSDDDLLF